MTQQHRNRYPVCAWPWFVGAGAVYAGTLVGTWWPTEGTGTPNLVPFRPHLRVIRRGTCTPEAVGAWRDLAINVVLLMPAALLLARAARRAWGDGFVVPTMVIGCTGSVVIEVGQLAIPGRVPDATDVLLNSLGVGISVALVGLWDARHAAR